MAFPHLSGLQRKFRDKGLRVVGVSLEEDSPQTRRFVEQQGSNMEYAVAVDSRGEAGHKLMGAAGVSGIPHAFVVDGKGLIRHHGHPMEPRFEQVVCDEAPAAAPSSPQQERKALPPVTLSREELLALPVRELKQILTVRNIRFEDLHEKPELVDRILEQCSRVTYYADNLGSSDPNESPSYTLDKPSSSSAAAEAAAAANGLPVPLAGATGFLCTVLWRHGTELPTPFLLYFATMVAVAISLLAWQHSGDASYLHWRDWVHAAIRLDAFFNPAQLCLMELSWAADAPPSRLAALPLIIINSGTMT
ncbi:hypothetical protein N2152v2_005671 [Parachlorella kessleri]